MILKSPQPKKLMISRKIKGQLTNLGKPLGNCIIMQKLTFNGNTQESNPNKQEQTLQYKTDEQGNFLIPAHYEMIQLDALEQFCAKNLIQVKLGDKQGNQLIDIWYEAILTEQPKPINGLEDVHCELTNKSESIYSETGLLNTNCTWPNMPVHPDPFAL